jgi:CheY-like chemotaxis protein
MLHDLEHSPVNAVPSTLSFSFKALELVGQLRHSSNERLTGYWQILLNDPAGNGTTKTWYLAVVRGQVVFSGTQLLSWESLIQTLQRYIPRIRTPQAQLAIQALHQHYASLGQAGQLDQMLSRMAKVNLVNYEDAIKAIRQKALSDLDAYLRYPGQAEFHPAPDLAGQAPIQGFALNTLLLEAVKRRVEWEQVQTYLPSVESVLSLKPSVLANPELPDQQKQQLQNLIKQGRSLEAIAYDMGKDALTVSKTFAQLVRKGWVTVSAGANQTGANPSVLNSSAPKPQPEIFIVDDSTLLIKQFQNLVTRWGYQVKFSHEALTAVQSLLAADPLVIFLDINMPGASGFDLIKQIRRQNQLATVPVVLLTAERSVSNQWRAQWASCKFLAKPRTPEEVPTFRSELQALLQELVPATLV